MPSELERALAAFRAALLAQDRQAAAAIVEAYGRAGVGIRTALERILDQLAEAEAAGEAISPAWLYQRDRLQVLLDQVTEELQQAARVAGPAVVRGQAAAVGLGQEHTRQSIERQLPRVRPGVAIGAVRLPTDALVDLVAVASDGGPLAQLLAASVPEAVQGVRAALVTGVVLGQGPRRIARAVRQAAGMPLVRALTISRTEILRAYRSASLRTMQAHADVVEGWTWRSALDARSCAFCWSLHGSVHPLDEPFASHPNCRCAPVPRTRTWAELGFPGVPETRLEVEPGPAAFRRLPVAQQRAILGPAKFRAYRAGVLSLEDLRGSAVHPRWGRVGYERPLKHALGRGNVAAIVTDAARTQRRATAAEIATIRAWVSQAGFATEPTRARSRLSGRMWGEPPTTLRPDSVLSPRVAHFLAHREEWPAGTTVDQYERHIAELVTDPASGILASLWDGTTWHLTFVGRSGSWRGVEGTDWIQVEYHVPGGTWLTAFHARETPDQIAQARRRRRSWWLQEPQQRHE